jgi:hypothetical protein
MDDATRRYWEQIANRCFDRAYATALSAATLLMDTTASANCGSKQGHQNGSDTDLEGSKK